VITADQLAAELRRAGITQVDTSTRRRAEYSTDASLYRVVPAAVVYPRDAEEVAAAIQVCRATGVPFTARGAGTSIAGNAVGPGVVADLRRHLHKIIEIDPDARTARVQPGLVLDALQAAARPHGLRFGPDPSSHNRCTIGGMIGNNACGTHAMAWGRTADNVRELQAVTGRGEGIGTGSKHPKIEEIVANNLATIRTELGRFSRQASGYALDHLLPENGADLAKALVGTEGPRTHYSLGWLPRWARLASIAPAAANRLAATRIAKRVAGIDPRRPLPMFAKSARVRPSTGAGDPVVLWIDTFTGHFAPEVAAAAVRVLEAAGFAVLTPSQRICCGLTFTSTGQFGAARRRLRRGLAALRKAAPAGVGIVGLEPSCVASLRDDARTVLGHDDSLPEVAGRVRTLAELLTARGFEPGRTDRHLLAQPHCHHHAVLGWDADRALLERTGATVTRVPGCCGLAGNFGMDHYDVSVAVAETHLLPAVTGAGDAGLDADLLADGFSCRTQLDHLTGRRARHLAELLADLL
jgi:FAD/FMN-containing dehydrogenase